MAGNEHVAIAHGGGRSYLRVRYTATSKGSTQVAAPMSLPDSDDLTLSYSLYLEPGWEFVKGGKLPGFCGGGRAAGGVGGDGTDGFTARFMWREEGALVVYAYHPDRPGKWGEDIATGATLPVGSWVDITQRIQMNDPGQGNGSVTVWINDEQVLDRTNMRWSTDGSFNVDELCFSTFYGGSNSSWSPSQTTYARFADFEVKSN